ncbi:MAG: hypothetical protein SV487_09180, partial [Thermodesulfobacteriota bacterium]|nr:hypothetical protein [Thermodesulfobacteriota bacterium]
GNKVGWVYWWSIAGSFLGSFGVGYLALPYLGLRGAFIFLISTSLGVGLTGWWLDRASGGPKASRLFRFVFPFVPFLASIWACAAFVNIPGNIYNYLMASNVTNVVEGITGVTYIKEGPGASYSGLYINSQAHGSLTPYKYNRDDLKAAIAVNLHPRPRNVLLIGLGNGRTLTAMERYREIKHIDVVEISRELVPALRNRTGLPWLHRALNSPKVNIILQDGRMFLNRTTKKYDLVLTAPIFAFNAYGGYLYSKQMLELIRNHLTESGVFVLLNDSLTPEMRFIQMKTFKSVFPFFILDNSNYLHGSSRPLSPDMKRIDESWTLNKDWLVAPGYTARSKKPYLLGEKGAFLGALRSDQNAFNDLAPFKINTDLEPRTEFWLFNYSRESERRPLPLSRRNLSYALPLDKTNLVRVESGWPVSWDQWRIDRWSDSASQAVVKADGLELHVAMPAPGNLKIHTGKRPLGRPPAPDDFQVSQAGTYYFVVNTQAKEPQGMELQVKKWDAKAKKWVLKGRKTVFLSPGQVEGYIRFTADGQPAHYCFSMGFYKADQWRISRASLYRQPPR